MNSPKRMVAFSAFVVTVTTGAALFSTANAQAPESVVDIPTRPGVTQRMLVLEPQKPKAAVVLLAGLPGPDGPDGVVLTSTILKDDKSRSVPAMALDKLRVPVLVVHHEQDGCSLCSFADMPLLTDRLAAHPRTRLLTFTGGQARGDPCEAFAYHGFNGLEPEVVRQAAAWVLAP